MRALVNQRNKRIRERRIPFTPEQLQQRLAYFGNRCWICSRPGEHADHVKPIRKGGWHMLGNIRPACATCNRRKNQTWPLTEADLIRIRSAEGR